MTGLDQLRATPTAGSGVSNTPNTWLLHTEAKRILKKQPTMSPLLYSPVHTKIAPEKSICILLYIRKNLYKYFWSNF